MLSRPALEPKPAVAALLELFATRPLVALCEWHGSQDEADFINALLHHPAFPATVQVIVAEIGNARHQAVVDRFIAGEPVAAADLRPVWREIFGWGFDTPIYEQFFRTVRAINRTLPPAQRLRVLLGDPPLDWSDEKYKYTPDMDWNTWMGQRMDERESFYTQVVETQVLAAGLRGLLIAGGAHFDRAVPRDLLPKGNTVQRLEQHTPGSVYVVAPHIGFGPASGLEPYLADWPLPAFLSLANSWLGEQPAGVYFGTDEPPSSWQGYTLSHLIDGYLYLGPRGSLTRSTANPAIYRGDEAYLQALQRRERNGVFTVDSLLTEGDPRLFPE